MKKILTAFFAFLALMFSCKGNKTETGDSLPTDSDSIKDTAVVDTMEQIIAETPMPKAADELFDDFFFNFAANKKLQIERTQFPLPVERAGKTDTIGKKQWKTDRFFMRQGYYTLIFDNFRQMNVVKDTSVNKVVVEKIYFNIKTVKSYNFNRVNGLWKLTSINYKGIHENRNASFLKFYHQFVTDSTFQAESISNPMEFIGPDPDDDFSQMEGLITPETWPAFAPELPNNMIYNIIYGEDSKPGLQRIFVIRGIANGLEMELTFKRKKSKWMLTKLSE
ncbi:MAG: DUF4348 domain-containing protein [Prevotella sp.]|nr:DUF4348 domain-containing protein [Prevotella sp.]MCI7089328.1 DUF4348 domain-containing protein [Prevotella sp.]MCI7256236.1 DUF4348 domain-containing protein [Prevotella sp.]MDD5784494.1 DUF4348 domain-containing protein [Prevotella sp.]MDD7225051.1 DUF4348 domain-containing protein [Prevotella sp.]